MEYQNVILTALLGLGCTILAMLLRNNRTVLLRYVTQLIREAEDAIRGSGLGQEKKAWVLAQLEAAGIRGTKWLGKQIDSIVALLNERGAWLTRQAQAEADHE